MSGLWHPPDPAPSPTGAAPDLPPEQSATPATPDPPSPRESPAAGMTTDWFVPRQRRAVITVEIPIDELAEAVMARIAQRMVQS